MAKVIRFSGIQTIIRDYAIVTIRGKQQKRMERSGIRRHKHYL
jgi:hypothetical protein